MTLPPPPLSALEHHNEFLYRHIGIHAADEARMLGVVDAASRRELIDGILPRSIARSQPLDLPAPVTEAAALAELKTLAAKNQVFKSFIGQGYYGTHTPGVILRNVLENPAWYTAYTPYQAEISQGRLEALLNFQTMVCELTGMTIANASMLDEATAAAEAMTLARRSVKSESNSFLVAADCHPQTLAVIQTRARPLGIDIKVGDIAALMAQGDYFGVLAQYPGSTGAIHDLRALVTQAHAQDAAFCVAADLLALTLLTPPGEWGGAPDAPGSADIVVGSTQRFGMPLGAGGPHAAYLACRDEFKRSMPGRLVGVSVDVHGNPALRLALQTREQHIRREKATSNICTAQVLPAVVASMYAVYHGPRGLTRIAQRVAAFTAVLASGLQTMGYELAHESAFDTVTVHTGFATDSIAAYAHSQRVNLRFVSASSLGISLDETTTRADVEMLWQLFSSVRPVPSPVRPELVEGQASTSSARTDVGGQTDGGGRTDLWDRFENGIEPLIPTALRRSSAFLTHPIFNTHHSETSMLRYLRALADKDLALDRSMIPLGSCTMKLNATSEMIPITWPEFADIHPFAPPDQLQGYAELDAQLRDWLCRITGYAGISLQPNAGSQGEYAGLLAIKAFHEAHGQGQRNICLIPSSAHGTNPASAHMAGLSVVVTACDAQGNVDLADLQAKCEQHSDKLACVMITYPSTHGVFETQVKELCALVHQHGGRVYVDGANMNALVGIAAPGEFGGDVSHLNLHKTFCIPHGGGGPGVGPVCVVADLVPYLPKHISAAPLGNASVLPISWMYCRMMGAAGLTTATEVAILSANYISTRLKNHYPTLYASKNGHVAHECILDLRPLKDTSGVTAEDVAKRLMDYGFHAPTLSFPVPGTLMVEPTESETLDEIDRFITAMIAIRAEIAKVERGEWPQDNNPLKHAPHTASSLLGAEWDRPYPRELAAYPLGHPTHAKYWPPIGRIDNVYGDRNLFCSCVPVGEDA